jgi:hypothetical protein
MNPIIEKYIKTKRFTDKVDRELTLNEIESLEKVIEKYGDTVFTRKKSVLNDRIINDRIPSMIKYGVLTIVENLEKIKTVRRNSLEHWRLFYGKHADKMYEERNKKSIQNEENFIERYGETEGKRLWNLTSKKKSTSMNNSQTLDWYINQYGKDVGEQKYNDSVINKSKRHRLEGYIEKYGEEDGIEIFKEVTKNREGYRGYSNKVHRLSQKTYIENTDVINPERHPRTLCGIEGGYQWDHIKSVRECFKQGISPEDAAGLTNLRVIPWRDNLARNRKRK